jgi:hypothetical protein
MLLDLPDIEQLLKEAGLDDDNAVHMAFQITITQGISTWAATETSLVILASELLGAEANKTGLVLYSITNFHTWLNIIDELFEIDDKFRPYRPQWKKISSTLRGLNDTRVRLAHHTILSLDHNDDISLRAGRYDVRKKSQKLTPLSPQAIYEFSIKVLHLSIEIMDLVDTMHGLKNLGQRA